MKIDFGKTAADYGRHRAGFPPAFFERLLGYGVGRPGQRALDLGCGTGSVARGLAAQSCAVTGLDPSESLMAQARTLDEAAGVTVEYVVGTAETTGLASASFDVVTAGQCWHWFEGPAAAREAARLLAPDGTLVIAHFDWLPLAGNVVAATERLILAHNPAWQMGGGSGLYPAWLGQVAGAGFVDLESFSFDLDVPYSHVAWRGRIRASAGVGASLPAAQVEVFDADLATLLARDFAGEPLAVPHRVWAVIARRARP